MQSQEIKCDCGKFVARIENGKIFVWCKSCKKEIELKGEPYEPRYNSEN